MAAREIAYPIIRIVWDLADVLRGNGTYFGYTVGYKSILLMFAMRSPPLLREHVTSFYVLTSSVFAQLNAARFACFDWAIEGHFSRYSTFSECHACPKFFMYEFCLKYRVVDEYKRREKLRGTRELMERPTRKGCKRKLIATSLDTLLLILLSTIRRVPLNSAIRRTKSSRTNGSRTSINYDTPCILITRRLIRDVESTIPMEMTNVACLV